MSVRTKALGRPKKGTKPKQIGADDHRIAVLYIKGSPEYAAFLDRLTEKTSISKVQLFRDAMRLYCETHGHEIPPAI